MVRIVLVIILFIFIARMFWRVVDNVIAAASGRAPGGAAQPPLQSAKMVRDPVCGTFLLPERALSVTTGRTRVYFCSEACRDRYRDGRTEAATGRTA